MITNSWLCIFRTVLNLPQQPPPPQTAPPRPPRLPWPPVTFVLAVLLHCPPWDDDKVLGSDLQSENQLLPSPETLTWDLDAWGSVHMLSLQHHKKVCHLSSLRIPKGLAQG